MPTGIHPELGWRYKVMNLFSATFHIFTNAGSKLKGRINQQSSVPIFAKKVDRVLMELTYLTIGHQTSLLVYKLLDNAMT